MWPARPCGRVGWPQGEGLSISGEEEEWRSGSTVTSSDAIGPDQEDHVSFSSIGGEPIVTWDEESPARGIL